MAAKPTDDAKPKVGKDGKAKPAPLKLPPVFTKLTFEGILLVFVPFVAFLLVFLYTMGLVPPRAAVIEIPVTGVQVAGMAPVATSGEATRAEASTGPAVETPGREAAPEPSPDITPAVVDSALAGDLPTGEGASADTTLASQARADSLTMALAQERTKRMKQIAKVYEQMNPASVAAIVSNMPQTDAVAILSLMTPRGAAKILSVLDPEKAATFTLELAQ